MPTLIQALFELDRELLHESGVRRWRLLLHWRNPGEVRSRAYVLELEDEDEDEA